MRFANERNVTDVLYELFDKDAREERNRFLPDFNFLHLFYPKLQTLRPSHTIGTLFPVGSKSNPAPTELTEISHDHP